MKIRLADYVADFLANKGVTDCFTVVGGGAMHLNDAFGHHKKIHCTYNHHEQASAIAAESSAARRWSHQSSNLDAKSTSALAVAAVSPCVRSTKVRSSRAP